MYIENGKPTEAGFEYLFEMLTQLEDAQELYDVFDETLQDKRDREALIIWLNELMVIEKQQANPMAFGDDVLYPWGKS